MCRNASQSSCFLIAKRKLNRALHLMLNLAQQSTHAPVWLTSVTKLPSLRLASKTSKLSRMSSSVIGCPIHAALYQIQAKNLNKLLSIMCYLSLSDTFTKTVFLSSLEAWKKNIKKCCLHNSWNRNGEHLFKSKFSLENRLVCLNTKFQKKKWKLWTFTHYERRQRHNLIIYI